MSLYVLHDIFLRQLDRAVCFTTLYELKRLCSVVTNREGSGSSSSGQMRTHHVRGKDAEENIWISEKVTGA
jgi:hypothetical protein